MANIWRDPIFDRTSYDVMLAIQQIELWKKNHTPASEMYDLKGCLNLSDLVRIEDNIAYLSNLLTSYRYPVSTYSKEWTIMGLPNENDMKRIVANIRSLFNGYYTPSNAEDIPEAMVSYQDVNAIEHNLFLLKEMLDAMQSVFIQSGTYKCGATSRLPIRR